VEALVVEEWEKWRSLFNDDTDLTVKSPIRHRTDRLR
jgi:hypothetical protein